MSTDLSKTEKVKALREELKIGRANRASQASTDSATNGGDASHALGTTFQDARGSVELVASKHFGYEDGGPSSNLGTASNTGSAGPDQRSPKRSIIRARRADRRSGEGDRSPAASTETTATEQPTGISTTVIGNLEAAGPIPSRRPEPPVATLAPPGRERDSKGHFITKTGKNGPKSGDSGQKGEKKPLLPQGKKLSAQEANALTDPFISALTDNFQYLDTYLWNRQEKAGKSTGEKPIWSDLDDEEIAALTRVMMRFGQHNEAAASVVRGVVESQDYITVGAIFVPRVTETVKIMRETAQPRTPRLKAVKP